jgi:hypothetical protein
MSQAEIPPGVDPTRPSPGRLYDYFLGGTDNFEIDRRTAEAILQLEPDLPDAVWANRGFLQRCVAWMAENGVDQFLDIGAGLPTRNNTHEAAQKVNPKARVAYVDDDPMVAAHAKSLLEGARNTVFVQGHFQSPETILTNSDVRALIDFSRPVGLLAVALLHFVPRFEDPIGLLHRYLDMIPSGSFLAISHATADHQAPAKVEKGLEIYAAASNKLTLRSKAEVTEFFDGLQIVPPYPGARAEVTYVSLWGAEDPELADSDGGRLGYCAVARKP